MWDKVSHAITGCGFITQGFTTVFQLRGCLKSQKCKEFNPTKHLPSLDWRSLADTNF